MPPGARARLPRGPGTRPRRAPVPRELVLSALPPAHAYRAAAAHALLRTLSGELRLSPFTLRAFGTALVLPVPSRLLGEVHLRILRVLYAARGTGSYAKVGEGRRGRGDDEEEGVGKFVVKRGGDNLYFLDPTTWPLFYEDYALATEDSVAEIMGQVGDEQEDRDDDSSELTNIGEHSEFIDMRSSAMLPMEEINLGPKRAPPRFLSRQGGGAHCTLQVRQFAEYHLFVKTTFEPCISSPSLDLSPGLIRARARV